MLSQLARVQKVVSACSDASLVEVPPVNTADMPEELPGDVVDLLSPANQVGTMLRCMWRAAQYSGANYMPLLTQL